MRKVGSMALFDSQEVPEIRGESVAITEIISEEDDEYETNYTVVLQDGTEMVAIESELRDAE